MIDEGMDNYIQATQEANNATDPPKKIVNPTDNTRVVNNAQKAMPKPSYTDRDFAAAMLFRNKDGSVTDKSYGGNETITEAEARKRMDNFRKETNGLKARSIKYGKK